MLKCFWNMLQPVQNVQKWLSILFFYPISWTNEEVMIYPSFPIIHSTNFPISDTILQISPKIC